MRPSKGSPSLPGWRTAQDGIARIRRTLSAAPLPVKIVLIVLLAIFFPVAIPAAFSILLLGALAYAPFAVTSGRRSVVASLSVAMWGVALVAVWSERQGSWMPALLVLPFAAVAAAHAGSLGRWFVPCRTVAWTLIWSLPAGLLASLIHTYQPIVAAAFGWLMACIVLGWRLAKSWQDAREFGRQQARGSALAAPHAWPASRPRDGRGPGQPADGRVALADDLVRAGHQGDGSRGQQPAAGARDRPAADSLPEITVDEAMAELDAMIGLTAVKDQIRSIAASIEAARRRALAGYGAEKPMQHFVFLGPPGTGKTAVARIIAKIFYAFGLLESPAVVEAHRADLVGEYLGATAIKTSELVDSALGGVLFIDEAYSLVNEGDGQGDRFGNEAVQALLKRAEDDRDDLIIILAGYEK
jgi:ATPase family associated with various cellular activities (AAA)